MFKMLTLAGVLVTAAFTAHTALAQGLTNPPPCKTYDTPKVQEHVKKALALAGKDMPPSLIPSVFIISRINGFCQPAGVAPYVIDTTVQKPVKIFDQLYYFGDGFVGVIVLKTSDGIIMFDGMNNEKEAEEIVDAGMRSVGLDPSTIKHLIVTHGHGDHWGGSRYFQNKYKTVIHMGAADWPVVEKAPQGPNRPIPPKKDKDIVDGGKLTLGDTTVTLYVTPGHTAASMSAVFPVTHNGTKHTASMWGGTGIPPFLEDDKQVPKRYTSALVYEQSIRKQIANGKAAGADVAISTHPIFDGTLDKAKVVAANPSGPNPWVLGKENWERYMNVNLEMVLAVQAMAEAKAAADKQRPGS